MCPPTVEVPMESDPLLALPAKTASTVRKNMRKKQKRNRWLLTISLGALAMVFGSLVVIKNAKTGSGSQSATPASVLGRAKAAKALVQYDSNKKTYKVDWGEVAPTTTFAELAKIMLLPWYEASMMALLEDKAWTDGIAPNNVRPIRRTLLMARDMLDVFSPVFPDTPDRTKKKPKKEKKKKKKDHSLWKELRNMYRHGYQLAGELHDLKGLTYSSEILQERVDAMQNWRKDFLAFQKAHQIRRYLYQDFDAAAAENGGGGGIDPNGCYYHKASHLFWADSTQDTLPCGNDPGPQSLRALASVQLEHSLGYLDIIEGYTTVMPREHEINFHNLRKELRIFVDEYNLFGNVLVPEDNDANAPPLNTDQDNLDNIENDDNGDSDDDDDYSSSPPVTLREKMDFLDTTQEKLGNINDHWTAHDVYVQDDTHPEKQKKLAKQTDELWTQWLEWESKNNLRGIMEEVMARMNSNA